MPSHSKGSVSSVLTTKKIRALKELITSLIMSLLMTASLFLEFTTNKYFLKGLIAFFRNKIFSSSSLVNLINWNAFYSCVTDFKHTTGCLLVSNSSSIRAS